MNKINKSKFNKKDIPIELYNRKLWFGAIRKGYFNIVKRDGNNGHTWRINEAEFHKRAKRYGVC